MTLPTILSNVFVATLVVRLEFDGAFRPPKDYGYPTIQAKLATCSASISIVEDSSQEFETVSPCALGCRWMKSTVGMTSAHTEYGGLLLGVEFLNELDSIADLLSSDNKDTRKCSLLIQGDCKVAIDQINGKSVPRKMETLHRRVSDLLVQMDSKFDRVEARHITRDKNILCDNLCGNLMNLIEWQEVEDCEKGMMESRHEQATSVAANIYARYLKDDSTCHIPYSKRPNFYHWIAVQCHQVKDFETLLEVGERRFKESALTLNKGMAAQGIRNQIDGWRGLGDSTKADYLVRKHRYLLSKFEDDISCDDGPTGILGGSPIEWKKELLDRLDRNLLEEFGRSAMAKTWHEDSTLWVSSPHVLGARKSEGNWQVS